MRLQGRCKVPSSRETHHADFRHIDIPLRGSTADQPHCPLRVKQRHRMPIPLRGKAVLQDEPRHPITLKPSRLVSPFPLHRQFAIRPARADEDRGCGSPCARGQEHRHGWNIIRPAPMAHRSGPVPKRNDRFRPGGNRQSERDQDRSGTGIKQTHPGRIFRTDVEDAQPGRPSQSPSRQKDSDLDSSPHP